MANLAYELMANPDIQHKLYEEISEMHNQLDGEKISYEKIQGLNYLDQVISETLRKWPVAGVGSPTHIKRLMLMYLFYR
jgi:cytochrome P450 family 9